jgi:mycothiol synthase
MTAVVQVRAAGLTGAEAGQVQALVRQAAVHDQVAPLSEHALLHLRHGGGSAVNLLLRTGDALAGFAHADLSDPAAGPSGELVIAPPQRRRGLGRVLLDALTEQAAGATLRVWAHGDLPAAAALAAAAGFRRVRTLWQMLCPVDDPPDPPRFAAGTTVRTFRPGTDEQAWTELNARAFQGHPEQGSWTRQDLELREREPWFDPAGFFLAERDGRLAGFHWTKIHPRSDGAARNEAGAAGASTAAASTAAADTAAASPAAADTAPASPAVAGTAGNGQSDGAAVNSPPDRAEPVGEVYVVGVDPEEQGSGLGRALTLVGLHYLRSRGLRQVMLYVDADNLAAIRLYETMGFTRTRADVMYAGPGG